MGSDNFRVLKLLVLVSVFSVCRSASCTSDGVTDLVDTVFASLGNDCTTYASLFSETAQFYHQHNGYKNGSQLYDNCMAYAKFCPSDSKCRFLRNGRPMVSQEQSSNVCNILVPYLWSELPANNLNLEPHTGWEFIQVVPDTTSFSWIIQKFAEVETSYSVPFNWGNPLDSSSYSQTVQMLKGTASKGECNTPIQLVMANLIDNYNQNNQGILLRQQGSAVVLAAGDLCHVVLPFALQCSPTFCCTNNNAQNNLLCTGYLFLQLTPKTDGYTTDIWYLFSGAEFGGPMPLA